MLQIMGRLIYDIFVCQEEEVDQQQQQQGTTLNLGIDRNLIIAMGSRIIHMHSIMG